MQCEGHLPHGVGRQLEQFAMHFKLAGRVCPESAGVIVAFCQHWLAPYTDHVARSAVSARRPTLSVIYSVM